MPPGLEDDLKNEDDLDNEEDFILKTVPCQNLYGLAALVGIKSRYPVGFKNSYIYIFKSIKRRKNFDKKKMSFIPRSQRHMCPCPGT